MVVVALGTLMGIDVCGWKEFGVPVGRVDADLPVAVMNESVVVAAYEDGVVEGGGPAVGPVNDVVAGAPAGRPVAAGVGTSPIAEDQGAA
jgi:hypothetical protein